MNPAAAPRDLWKSYIYPLGWRVSAILLCGAAFLVGGCGSSSKLVKSNFDPKPILANAISKAVCFAGRDDKCKPETGSFTHVPLDESSPVVRRFIKEYAYGQRETMKRYLTQAEQYLPMVKSMAKENGAPEDLAYLFLLESGANPEARSPANALGMWQFMPATARSYGLRVDNWVDERLDPRKSTQAALTYLKDLYGMFGCWRLALSAYNSGENKMNKVLCQEDANEYDEICSSNKLKRETREFVPRFQAIAHIAKHADKYGFSKPHNKTDDPQHEFAMIEGSYSIEKLAKAMRLDLHELMELNPSLIRGMTPPEPHYSIRIPRGKKNILLAKLKDVKPDEGRNCIVHVVNRGDSLTRISKRYGIPKTKLAHLNPDVNFSRKLKAGAKIFVPAKKTQTKERILKKSRRLSALR